MLEIDLKGKTEEDLVRALQAGQREALSLLYDAYSPVLLGLVARILPTQEAAEEVLLACFVHVWGKIRDFNPATHRLLTWLLGIARQLALAKKNSTRAFAPGQDQKMTTFASDNQPDTRFPSFHGLASPEKAVLDLVYLQGYTCPLAAEELGLTEEALKVKLRIAFTQIRAEKTA